MIPIGELTEINRRVIASIKGQQEDQGTPVDTFEQAIERAVRQGQIRLARFRDDDATFEELAGDCFNPAVNDSIPVAQLKREEINFKARIRRSGTWLYQSQFWTGREWEAADVMGGFVGWDFMGSGYEAQLMAAALESYQGQPLDAAGFAIDPYLRAA